MNETNITLIGNVLTSPEWRLTSTSRQKVTSFKVASTARRLDRESGKWVDGNSLRVRVNCWRNLADGVAQSIMLGDPVIVFGRLYTRDWVDSEGTHRTLYELEALSVGHDYSRGRAKFARNRPNTATSANEAPDELRIGGEATIEAPDLSTGLSPDDPLHDSDGDPAYADPVGLGGLGALGDFDPMGVLREGGLDAQVIESYLRDAVAHPETGTSGEGGDEDESDDHTIDPLEERLATPGPRGRRRREPVPV
ncbi:single-strand DNA-binding protein [Allocatelliglobosispora scoriae]|uniref:Single-strand DNA-binding protein n=1 Tax=Allocatelliglobosispora scoriae TaxID=643052 RepID=A0A841BXA4_9ACTN|nr:single-stranded DNA-binding protein [Allocatelliglobosispora scoriae]MBB5872146.1 single-strand DNA-binding protein [Allocatelliglobosispora scoriae]